MGGVDVGNAPWVPQVEMQFGNEDEAYEFYNKYAEIMGFSVRRSKMWTTSKDVLAARTFVCSKQGFRQKKKGFEPKKPRPATRTGCPACLTIKITPTGRYRVTDFISGHNHQLANPLTSHTLRSHRPKTKGRFSELDSMEDPKMVGRTSQGHSFQKSMVKGDAGAVLEYLQKMQVENPLFYYAVRINESDNMSGFFWADAKSMMDYIYFGDVVCFDTTYKTSDYGRPLILFLGVNHHKQLVLFGTALLYDGSRESYAWLFETFKTVMRGKQPKAFLSDRSEEISDVIAEVWPGAAQRLCVWHLFQNATMQLSQVFEGSKTFASEFSRCIFECEEVEEFVSAWESLIEKYDLKDNEWLVKQFEERERWGLPFGRDVFCADFSSTLVKENWNTFLKKGLGQNVDMLQFLEHYDKVVEERRNAEMRADFNACQSLPRIPSFRMLKQAASAYTPAIFKVFEKEFELHMDCMVYSCGEIGATSDYKVIVEEKPKPHFVRYDSVTGTLLCSCKKFEFAGIQCRHVFKVLDFRNIKELPSQYILKRWRKDAKIGTIRHDSGYIMENDPKSSFARRYNYLCYILSSIAARAAKTTESSNFIESQMNLLSEQVEQLLHSRPFQIPYLISATSNEQRDVLESLADSLQHDSNAEAGFVGGATNGNLIFKVILALFQAKSMGPFMITISMQVS